MTLPKPHLYEMRFCTLLLPHVAEPHGVKRGCTPMGAYKSALSWWIAGNSVQGFLHLQSWRDFGSKGGCVGLRAIREGAAGTPKCC